MRRGPVSTAAWLGILGLIAGCGLQADNSPRDIRPVEQTSTRDATSTTRPRAGLSAKIFLLSAGAAGQPITLVAVRRDVDATPKARVEALLAGLTTDEQQQRLQTALAPGTELIDAEVRPSGLALIDLSSEFVAVSDEILVDAVAQLVFTVCELPGVDRVQILIQGQPQDWPRGDRTLTASPLTTFDFPGYNPTTQPAYPAVPSATIPEPTPTT